MGDEVKQGHGYTYFTWNTRKECFCFASGEKECLTQVIAQGIPMVAVEACFDGRRPPKPIPTAPEPTTTTTTTTTTTSTTTTTTTTRITTLSTTTTIKTTTTSEPTTTTTTTPEATTTTTTTITQKTTTTKTTTAQEPTTTSTCGKGWEHGNYVDVWEGNCYWLMRYTEGY